ncbi:MAG: diacylglycerol/lipid kinase family protein [Polyangiaceae bacterium]
MLRAVVLAGVDVILNERAGGLVEGSPLRDSIRKATSDGGARLHPTRSLDELATAARYIAARGTDAVVIAGGDGTTMASISALATAWPEGAALPPIALAGGGTVCTIARNFGARGAARSWADRVVRATCDGSAITTRKPTLHVRDSGGGDRVGFIFGTGLVARFFEVYDASPRRGLATAAAIAARVFAGSFAGSALARRILDPAPCTLTVDGIEQPSCAWSLVLASVVRDVGLHLLATYRAGQEFDRFHVIASGLPARALGAQMPRVLAGRPLKGEPRVDALARSLVIHFADASGAYVLDGDVMHAQKVTLEAGPTISVLTP